MDRSTQTTPPCELRSILCSGSCSYSGFDTAQRHYARSHEAASSPDGAAFLLFSPAAHADKQGFLDYIHSQGVPPAYFGTAGADYSNVKAAEMICDVFHNGGGPADIPFLGFSRTNTVMC